MNCDYGTIFESTEWVGNTPQKMWVYLGGNRGFMDFTGYTMPTVDYMRWIAPSHKKINLKVKYLKFRPAGANDCSIPIFYL